MLVLSYIFAALALFPLLLFVFGMINPKLVLPPFFTMRTRPMAAMVYIILFFVLIFIAALLDPTFYTM